MRMRLAVLILAGTYAVLLAGQASAPDTIILNGRIFTGDPAAAWAEALAVRDGRITRVGTTAAIRPTAGKGTRIIDAGGRLVIPGINDAHTHPTAIPPHTPLEGPPAMQEDPSLAQILARVEAAARTAPPGGWILGEIGPNVLGDPKASRSALDPVSGGRPVMLTAWTGHGTLFNTAALRALGVGDTDPDPPGGWYGRVPGGSTLTGLAHEYAEFRLRQKFSMTAGEDAQIRAYQDFASEAASYGITSVQAMMTGYPAERAAALFTRAALPVRVRVIDVPMQSPGTWGGAVRGAESPMVTISGAKYILDGTPVERLMYLREPYSDARGTSGRANFEPADLRGVLTRMAAARVQPMFHAAGDAAIDLVLEALERVELQTGGRGDGGRHWASLRPRLEHADMFEPGHIDRAKRLGVIVVQNPAHFMAPELLHARVGPRRSRLQIVKSILRAGVPLALGSDGPLNPHLNIMFAAMHPANPDEALTVEEALVAYTRGSAYAEMAEEQKGTLAPGRLADLAILSQDIFAVPLPDLPKTSSLLTMVGGRVVHERVLR